MIRDGVQVAFQREIAVPPVPIPGRRSWESIRAANRENLADFLRGIPSLNVPITRTVSQGEWLATRC